MREFDRRSPRDLPPPEKSFLDSSRLKNATFLGKLPQRFPVTDTTSDAGIDATNGLWGASIAITSAKLGIPLGFERSTQVEDATRARISGSEQTINYWLTLAGFEHRYRENLPENDSRSGLFTLMVNPQHGQLFEHLYALRTGKPLREIVMRDPMAERGIDSLGMRYQFNDHEGVQRLYEENPEHAIRLYLTRQLPQLKHLRRTIESTKQSLEIDAIEDEAEKADGHSKKILMAIGQERREMAPFNQARLDYWQTEYDFTTSLLMEGYEPYTLEETVPFVEEYVIGLLAEHPELSPTDLRTDVPDVKGGLVNLLSGLKKRATHEGLRDNSGNN